MSMSRRVLFKALPGSESSATHALQNLSRERPRSSTGPNNEDFCMAGPGTRETVGTMDESDKGGRARSSSRRKRHHYLPQSYLRLWADEKGQVQIRRRASPRSFPASTVNVAVEADLYSVVTETGIDDSLERRLPELEAGLPALLEDLRGGKTPRRGSSLREEIASHLALQLVRTSEHVQRWYFARRAAEFTGEWPAISKEGMRRFLAEEYLGSEPRDGELQGALDFAYITLTQGLPEKAELLAMQFQIAETEIVPRLASRAWAIERCPSATFWTCDKPVATWCKNPNSYASMGAGLEGADEIRFPLGPHHLLVARPAYPEHRVVVSRDRVAAVNWSMAAQSHTQVIGSKLQRADLDALTLLPIRPGLRFNNGPLYEVNDAGESVPTGSDVLHLYMDYGDEAQD